MEPTQSAKLLEVHRPVPAFHPTLVHRFPDVAMNATLMVNVGRKNTVIEAHSSAQKLVDFAEKAPYALG